MPRSVVPPLPPVGEWRFHRLRDGRGRPTGMARLRDLPARRHGSWGARLGGALTGRPAHRDVVHLEVEFVAGASPVAPYDFDDQMVWADAAGERDPRWRGWTGPGVSEAVWNDERGVEHWLGAEVEQDEGEPWFAHLGGLAVGR